MEYNGFGRHECGAWQRVRDTAPSLYNAFGLIQAMLNSVHASRFIGHVYECIPNVNFSSHICQPLARRLRVLPVPINNVGWSDWGTVASILRTLREMGQIDSFRLRLEECQVHPSWYTASLAEVDLEGAESVPDSMTASLSSEAEAYLSPE